MIVEKVQKLIALAASPNEEEARTSARIACHLIRKHGLQLSEGSDPASPSRPARAYRAPQHIVAREASRCWECGEPIRVGDTIQDDEGKQPMHVGCT